MSIQLVVFDMAGTTVYDGDAVHTALCEAIRAADYPVTRDEANEVMGLPKPLAIRLILEKKFVDASSVTEELVNTVFEDFLHRMIEYYRTNPAVREIPGTGKVFQTLHANGIKVGIDTGFSRPIANVIIERLGWADQIDVSVTSDEVANGRPHPDLIYRAMELTGIADVKSIAKVGDTPSDLQEGSSAGCGLVIGVTEGSHTREQMEPFAHTHLIPDITHLPALLGLKEIA